VTTDTGKMRIFQIGFNRCGTSSFAYFFNKNGLRASHWQNGTVAAAIETARIEGKPLLTYTGKYQVYTDMELMDLSTISRKFWNRSAIRKLLRVLDPENGLAPIYAYKHFKVLDEQYPGSKFILNVRDMERWVASRFRFSKQRYRSCLHGDHYHGSDEELAECWRSDWRSHISNVKEYFADRPDDLLIFDIETDGVEKIIDFFSMLKLDPGHWKQRNASSKSST